MGWLVSDKTHCDICDLVITGEPPVRGYITTHVVTGRDKVLEPVSRWFDMHRACAEKTTVRDLLARL